jgi:MULE transposase domain
MASSSQLPWPCCLTRRKIHTRLFQELVAAATGIQRQLRPQVVHTDFEMAAINALYNVFGVHPTGCLFHFTQCIYRKVIELGMKVEYHTDNPQGTRKWIRRIMALQKQRLFNILKVNRLSTFSLSSLHPISFPMH